MTAERPPHIVSLGQLKAKSEDVAARAKHVADTLRADYAAQLLHAVFPEHTLAIFARHWDEAEPALVQLLSRTSRVPDLEFSKGHSDFDALQTHEKSALINAEQEIMKIGSDDDILEHLDPGAEEHRDWTEFVLYLDPDREGRAL